MEKKNTKKDKFIENPADWDLCLRDKLPIMLTLKNGASIVVNDELSKTFFLPKEKITIDYLKTLQFFDSANRKILFDNLPFIQSNISNDEVRNYTLRVTDDEKLELQFQIISARSANPDVEIVSVFVNVSGEAEKYLNISETLSSIQTVLYSTNSEGTEYNFISDAVRNMFGFEPDEIYQNKLGMLRTIYREHFREFQAFIEKLKTGEESVVEYRMKDRFGKEHWLRHSGIPIKKSGKIRRIVGAISDITEEKKMQIKMEKSEERFRLLVDTADDLIFILDGFGYFWMVNKNGANALGYTPEEMKGRHFLEFIDKNDESKIASAFTKILNTEGVTTFEVVFLDRFDRAVTFEVNAKSVINNGEVTGMLSIGRNITRRKADEQKIRDLNSKLIEANRIIAIERERARHKITVLEELNKLKGEFISNVSHELRTPLASVVGFAETIESDPDLPSDSIKEFANIILTEGKRLARLIDDLLDFSKLDSGNDELVKEELNLIGIVNQAALIFENQIREKNISYTTEFPDGDLIINGDKERLLKVFHNLISNAVKFTNPSGRITILIKDFDKEVEIAVSDTGVGIPEREIPNLFQKFSRVQRLGSQVGGAGFGLVTIKQIVDMHKGFIKVRSEVDKGTSFIIRLPK